MEAHHLRVGVTAPIVGTTSLDNLKDLLGMWTTLRYLAKANARLLGAVHISLTEEEVKYLEEPYQARAAIGHR